MRVIVIGRGKMGTLLSESAAAHGHEVIAMADAANQDEVKPLDCDAVIDFSHPDNLEWVCAYVRARHCVLICGTTGLNDAQKQLLQQTAQKCPVFYSANFSYGIAMLEKMLEMLTPLLKEDFDMEVVEAHHGQKQDAPSGTAAMLVEAMDPHHEFKRVYGREGFVGKRGKEIGIHAIRGGTVAGEHTVLYLGEDESLKITHTASSRMIFVNGAWKALDFMAKRPNGYYTMKDLTGEEQ